MSLAAILESIERDARDDADRQLAAATDEAARLRAEAEAAAERRLATAVAAAEPALRAEAARVVNAARLRLLRRRAEIAAERADAAWRAAGERLRAIADADRERWRRALDALTTEALAMAGPAAVVAARAADANAIASLVEARGGRLEALGRDAPPGVVVRSADGRLEIDATLPARLERARDTLTAG